MDDLTLQEIFGKFRNLRILVIGDIMLDHYIHGHVERISPEAPVPVLDVAREEFRLGGSGNVADNLIALGAKVMIIGVVGKDQPGKQILSMLRKKKIDVSGVVVDSHKQTTVKTRIMAHQQQIVRIDREDHTDIIHQTEKQILDVFTTELTRTDAVIIEDYNKGLLTDKLIGSIIHQCNKAKKPVAVDPKFKNFFAYRNCTLFKPNFSELQKNLGKLIETEEQFSLAITELEQKISAEYVIITRGEKGLSVFSKGSKVMSIPTFAREIYDVSGAGDTVISALTMALTAGCSIGDAAIFANHAAGVVCGKMGTSVAFPEEILQSFRQFKE